MCNKLASHRMKGNLDRFHLTQVRTVAGPTEGSSLQVIQDDLLHPVLGGNKLRKLDALLPALEEAGVRHVVQHVPPMCTNMHPGSHGAYRCMQLCANARRAHSANQLQGPGKALGLLAPLQVTCGGLQSAHCAAVAAACAERGMRAHLLVRGERPQVCLAPVHELGRICHWAMACCATRQAFGSRCCYAPSSTCRGYTGSRALYCNGIAQK